VITEVVKPTNELMLGEILDALKAGITSQCAFRESGGRGGLLSAVCGQRHDLKSFSLAEQPVLFDGDHYSVLARREVPRLIVIGEERMNRHVAARLLRRLADELAGWPRQSEPMTVPDLR
jgi:hypothetical protein